MKQVRNATSGGAEPSGGLAVLRAQQAPMPPQQAALQGAAEVAGALDEVEPSSKTRVRLDAASTTMSPAAGMLATVRDACDAASPPAA